MAIVEMSKIKLVGMTAEKDQILDAIQKTGCVEVSVTTKTDEENSSAVICVSGDISAKYEKIEKTIEFLVNTIDKAKGQEFYPKDLEQNGKEIIVSYDEFCTILEKERRLLEIADELKLIDDQFTEIKASKIKLNNLCSQLDDYVGINDKLSDFRDTEKVKVFFGAVRPDALNNLINSVSKENGYAEISLLSNDGTPIILALALKENADELLLKLNEAGFSKCPFNFACTAKQKVSETMTEILKLDEKILCLIKKATDYYTELKNLKILADYYKYLLEKEVKSENFAYTARTFTLEGYVPTECIETVTLSLKGVSNAIYLDYSKPTKEDTPPTLTRNGKFSSQAEFITDMYSVPDYREIDPNKIVFFFFMLFMGVIMADIGYGIMMVALGGVLASRIQIENGAKKLWRIILYGGVFTIIFGVLFNSLLGFSVLPFTLLPSPVTGTIDDIMIILLLCLLLGVIQIAVGYFMKALNCFKQRDIVGGICDGLIWVTFFVGFIFATFNFLLDYLMTEQFVLNPNVRGFFDKMQKPGLIVVVATLIVAALTAGRNEKGFGKFSKGFGAIYGLINIMSDILSYARLFGLMLSGMIIATTFNDIGLSLMTSVIGYVLGGLVMVLGHIFNIAMGVLGAYIHDSRLQYIEFFSKFYTGEGNKFTPIGSKFKYVYIKK